MKYEKAEFLYKKIMTDLNFALLRVKVQSINALQKNEKNKNLKRLYKNDNLLTLRKEGIR